MNHLPRFEYRAARSVVEAVSLWADQPGSRYLAGGTDLLPQVRNKRPLSRAIDLKGICHLAQIEDEGDGIRVGATAPLAAVCAHAGIRTKFPLLVECAEQVGAWPLRNRATLVGNVCNASPAADTAVALLCLDAQVITAGKKGERRIAIAEFFKGPGKTALEEGELVTAVRLPNSAAGYQGKYLRLSRRKGMDLATVGVLVGRGLDGSHRVALAAVAPTPLRLREAEKALDARGAAKALQEAARIAAERCSPITDLRGSAEYRRQMVGVLVARAAGSLN
jgi:carbon-monoxide dehydrogenase medium subunit